LNVPNVTGDRRWRGEEEEKLAETIGSKIRAFLGIPGLDSQGRVNVAITLTRARHLLFDGMEFREEEERLVSAITAAVSVVIELKDAREEIELRVKELQAILDAAGEEISVVDPQFVIRFVNKAKRDKFKKDGELVGRKCYKVYEKRPKVCPDCPIKKAMTQARHGDLTPVQSTNHWGCPKGGRAYKAAVTASAIVGPRNKVLGAVELVRDLTQVEEANRRLMQDAARKARQHLTSIRGRTDLLASQWDGASPKWRQCLERHADRLRRLIEQADTYMARWERKPLVARTGSR
jgi:PAS domain-containing protein